MLGEVGPPSGATKTWAAWIQHGPHPPAAIPPCLAASAKRGQNSPWVGPSSTRRWVRLRLYEACFRPRLGLRTSRCVGGVVCMTVASKSGSNPGQAWRKSARMRAGGRRSMQGASRKYCRTPRGPKHMLEVSRVDPQHISAGGPASETPRQTPSRRSGRSSPHPRPEHPLWDEVLVGRTSGRSRDPPVATSYGGVDLHGSPFNSISGGGGLEESLLYPTRARKAHFRTTIGAIGAELRAQTSRGHRIGRRSAICGRRGADPGVEPGPRWGGSSSPSRAGPTGSRPVASESAPSQTRRWPT